MVSKFIAAMAIVSGMTSIAFAEGNPDGCNCNEKHNNRHASLYYENDALGVLAGRKESDKWYTNGLKLVYSYDESCALPQTKAMYSFTSWMGSSLKFPDDENTRHGVVIAQLMFTPKDITTPMPQPDDRFYGGWLYFGHVLQHVSDNARIKTAEVDVGIVGPRSFAEPLQKFIHREVLRTKVPQGWGHQIGSGLGLQFSYNDIDKLGSYPVAGAWGIDASRYWGGTLGTLFDNAKVGLILRAGNNLDSVPAAVIESPLISDGRSGKSTQDQVYFLLRLEGQGVLHNTFVDGSFFHAPPIQSNIKRKPLVWQTTAGVVWAGICGCENQLSFMLTWRTPEFTSPTYNNSATSVFGTLNYEWKL